jgi:hypothetical protein
MLLLRDSNWSPDFPTSAQVAQALFQQDQGLTTDGVVALDLEAVRLLVAALEPLPVLGMPEPMTGANVIAVMKRAWQAPSSTQATLGRASDGEWWQKRKDFMGEVAAAALERLLVGDSDPSALAHALLEMLDGRHLQIAVDDPALASLLATRNWDGSLRPPSGEEDFLAVIDSNVGYNKANAAVQTEVYYRVERSADNRQGPVATLVLSYTHTALALPVELPCDRTPSYGDSYDEMTRRCYWNYLRVYAPGGSELLGVEGVDQPQTERGERYTTVFAGAFVLRPAAQHVVTLRYRLPETVSVDPFRLVVRKQAGTLAPLLQVESGPCRWSTDLGQDRRFACTGP